MTNDLKKMIKVEKWKRWNDANNIHMLEEGTRDLNEPTQSIRRNIGKTQKDTIANKPTSGRRPVDTFDDLEAPETEEETEAGNVYAQPGGGALTDMGKAALKANTVWSNNLTQLLNFQAGKQLAMQLGQKLAAQTGIDAGPAEQIAEAVMKQVLEHLDALATAEMEKTFSGIFDRTRGKVDSFPPESYQKKNTIHTFAVDFSRA